VQQVGAVLPSERGSLITMSVVVSKSGNYILPFVVFPRKIFRDYLIANGPEGSLGSENKSGLITDDFVFFMEYFIKHTMLVM
jgi:hypothetical protein